MWLCTLSVYEGGEGKGRDGKALPTHAVATETQKSKICQGRVNDSVLIQKQFMGRIISSLEASLFLLSPSTDYMRPTCIMESNQLALGKLSLKSTIT